MALVQLSDIIDITTFKDLPAVNSPEKTAFWESGIIASSPVLDNLAKQPGKISEMPFWKDVDLTSEVNYSTDDPTDIAAPEKIVQGEQIARKAFVNKGWSESDLASELVMGGTAMRRIKGRTDAYFTAQFTRRLLSTIKGVMADNVANDASDMVIDVAAESIATQTADTKFNNDVFTDAAYTMGDMVNELSAISMHSSVMKQISKQGDIETIRDSDGNLLYYAYKGLRIIMDDLNTIIAGSTDGFKYVSTLFGSGAFGYGEGDPANPVAIERAEDQGNGAGVETLWVRKTWLLHPFGFQQIDTPAGTSFTLAELAAATSWDRVIERKNIPLSFLVTN